MGREVRRVPKDWQHPRDDRGRYIPMKEGTYDQDAAEWRKEEAAWKRGEFPEWADAEDRKLCFSAWAGEHPDERHYMPNWPEAERTHLQMYEDTSEGTPISPVMETPEELARWLADTGASAFGGMTATYEHWLAVCRGGWAPSMILDVNGLRSGVEAMADKEDADNA